MNGQEWLSAIFVLISIVVVWRGRYIADKPFWAVSHSFAWLCWLCGLYLGIDSCGYLGRITFNGICLLLLSGVILGSLMFYVFSAYKREEVIWQECDILKLYVQQQISEKQYYRLVSPDNPDNLNITLLNISLFWVNVLLSSIFAIIIASESDNLFHSNKIIYQIISFLILFLLLEAGIAICYLILMQCAIKIGKLLNKMWRNICHFIRKIKSLPTLSKLQFYFLAITIIMLLTAFEEWDNDGYYTFLRIITTISLAWFCFMDFPVFVRFIFLLGVILYNPVFPIYLGDRDIWLVFNVITVAALLAGGIAAIRKLKHKEIKE